MLVIFARVPWLLVRSLTITPSVSLSLCLSRCRSVCHSVCLSVCLLISVSCLLPTPVISFRRVWSGVVLILIVVCDAVGWMDLLTVACLGVSSLLLARSLTVEEALAATRPRILIMVAASFALGSALQNTGVSDFVAKALVDSTASAGPFWLLLGINFTTALVNAVVSNNACMVRASVER